MILSERQKISLKRIIVFILSLVLIIEAFSQYGQQAFVKAKEQAEAKYALYVDTSMVGVDAELLENGIGAYFYDAYGNASSESPTIMEKVGERDHLYKVDIDEQYPYVTFTEGTDLNTVECTSRIAIDWGLGVPCFKLNSENVMDGGAFYGLYTVYFDTNNVAGAETFTENGVGVYAYNSETESYSSTPVAMKESDKGEGIYEYSFDQPYQYIAFMNGYDNWNYSIATAPVYTEWGYAAPCFLLQTVNGEASTGLWWNLTSVVYFDASEIKDDDAFVENGVYLYAYNEKENGEKELLSETPIKMLASGKGEDMYEYTLDKPYENVQYILGDSFDAEIRSEVVAIDWLSYAEPCYKMTLERSDEASVSSSDAEALQPMDEARVTADGLSVIRVSRTMEWLGTGNTISTGSVSENAANSADESTNDGNDTDEDSTDESTTDESSTGDVQVDGELTDLGGDATTATVAAAVMLTATSSTTVLQAGKYVYLDTSQFTSWEDGNAIFYLHCISESDDSYVLMSKVKDHLYKCKIPEGTLKIQFVRGNPNTTAEKPYWNYAPNGVGNEIDISGSSVNCYQVTGWGAGQWASTSIPEYAGYLMYFYDMTSTGFTEIQASFYTYGDSGALSQVGETTTLAKDESGYWSVTIPENCEYVEFKSGDTVLGKYYFQGESDPNSVEGYSAVDYVTEDNDTFYYGVTENENKAVIASVWGAKPTANDSLADWTLYFYKEDFPVASMGQLLVGGVAVELKADDNGRLFYTFPADTTATQETILTYIATDGTKYEYNFQWNDFSANVVTLSNNIASVAEKYFKATTVYFDATLSKLSYSNTTGALNSGQGIPYPDSEIVYYYAMDENGSLVENCTGTMTKVSSSDLPEGKGTWQDVYKIELPEGCSKIRFAAYILTTENVTEKATNGDGTEIWDIPVNLKEPCFYADNSDDVIYNGGNRGGYWDEVYTTRDAEKGKGTDVVDIIDTESLTRASNVLYINSTFYDYYSDYELNGYNRDSYGGSNGGSQRNWVTFRQFNQALSDYYDENDVNIPIYTGHFQPSVTEWSNWFEDVASTLNLYGYDNYNLFFSTNNSNFDINGNRVSTLSAAQKLVADNLIRKELMLATANSGFVAEPHFDEDFLTGENSKNAVLGEVYKNVAFPFVQDEINDAKYWVFDSKDTTLAMRKDPDTKAYYLKRFDTQQAWSKNVPSAGDFSAHESVTYEYGFFPFNEETTAVSGKNYNYGFGAKLEFEFRLTEDGQVYATDGKTKVPIIFEFAGDDDVWVFIDNELVLDIGGAHGVASGNISFKDTDGDTENGQMTITSKVTAVKESAGSTGETTSSHILEGDTTTVHTLTMYYMERGMWESNMRITFNFPDENQLEVEKQVDETDVNEWFKGLFENKSLFTYHIKNLATHYGTTGVSTATETVSEQTFNTTFADGELSQASTSNVFAHESSWQGRNDVVHWKALYDDSTGTYREYRYGQIALAGSSASDSATKTMDISNMSYLQFDYYYDYTDTPSLTNMYLQLVDVNGKIMNTSAYLSSKTYGMVTMGSQQWITVKVDLNALTAETDFDKTQVAAIRFGYNFSRDIYLDNFIFYPSAVASTLTGFVTKQYDIPDYGSASSGELAIPVGAIFSSSLGEYRSIGSDGTFVLQDGETVVFKDQFRRGSYIYLEEKQNPLFDTSWTMYENGQAVTSFGTGYTVENDLETTKLKDVESAIVSDGRTEILPPTENNSITDEEGKNKQEGNKYNGTRPDNTFVFRSYSNPDVTTTTTKLKVVFTNKINVGSLKIDKKAKYDNETLEGTYTFKVTFYNVGGIALEEEAIVKEITITGDGEYTITGIPLGTYYTIEEVGISDKSYLDKVEVSDTSNMYYDSSTKVVQGKINKETTEGVDVVAFTNTKEPKISVATTKIWQDEEGNALTENLPDKIYVRLQRRVKGSSDAFVAVSGYEKIEFKPQYLDKGDGNGAQEYWELTIDGLDKMVDYAKKDTDDTNDDKEWEYRFVEIQVVGSGEDEKITVIDNGKVITLTGLSGVEGDYEVTYTNTANTSETDQDDTDSDTETDTGPAYSTEITNTLLSIDLKIHKSGTKDGVIENLSGVIFQLEKVTTVTTDTTGNTVYGTPEEVTTDEDGIATFANLENGTYRLTELKTASGYTLLKEPLIIEIDRVSNTYRYCPESEMEKEADEREYKVLTLTLDDTTTRETYSITLEIYNAQNIVLPTTGWSSPISLATGIILLSICLALCLMYRCKISKSRREGKPPG